MNEIKIKDCTLLPCPFCGNDDIYITKTPLWTEHKDGIIHGYMNRYEYKVVCDRCGAHPEYSKNDTIYRSECDAMSHVISTWNKRSIEPPSQVDENAIDDKSDQQIIVDKLESIIRASEFLLTRFNDADTHYILHSIAADACHILDEIANRI